MRGLIDCNKGDLSRRDLLKVSGVSAVAVALGLVTFPAGAQEFSGKPKNQIKVVVAGGHPDDPETGCGGTMILLAEEGYEVVSAYLTRGEAGIPGKSYEEAAQIRTKEALDACKIMKARAVFLNQIDGSSEITANRYEEMYEFLKAEKPDVVITHWPVDGHRDHRICSILVYDAWIKLNKIFGLYYFEVESGTQSQNFTPTNFVDISRVIEKKHEACFCHVSQNMERVYQEYHESMEIFRGMQANCKYAEAFIKHDHTSLKIV